MTIYTILKSWFYVHPGVSFWLSITAIMQSFVFIGAILGYLIDQKSKRSALAIDVERFHYYKKQAESLEKYRYAAGKMEFYKKEAEHKNHDNIRLRRKLASMLNMLGEEV